MKRDNGDLKNWQLKTIGQIAETFSGGTPNRSIRSMFGRSMFGGVIPWVKSSELNQIVISSTEETLSQNGFEVAAAKWIPANTPLIAMYGATAGKVGWLQIRATTNQAILAILPRDATILSRWLYWSLVFNTQNILLFLQGSGQPNLSKAVIDSTSLFIPPLDEQRRIADILDAADAAIEQNDALIAKLQLMREGLLHDLLTRGVNTNGELRDPVAHPEQFVDTALGMLPREWDIQLLEQCVRPDAPITYGIVQAGPHVKDGVPYIRTGDMAGDRLEVNGLLRTSRQIAASYHRSEVHTSEIVCTIRATVGKILEVPSELEGANLTQGTARIAPRTGINSRYLLWALRSSQIQHQFEQNIKGTTFSEITLGSLRRLVIPVPASIIEQKLIADILDAHDVRIRTEEAYSAKLRKVKQGLMDDLLSGRIRV